MENLKSAYIHSTSTSSCASSLFPQLFFEFYRNRNKCENTEEGRRMVLAHLYTLINAINLIVKDENEKEITNDITFRKFISLKVNVALHILDDFVQNNDEINFHIKNIIEHDYDQFTITAFLTKTNDCFNQYILEYGIIKRDKVIISNSYEISDYDDLFINYSKGVELYRSAWIPHFRKVHVDEIFIFIHSIFVLLNNANKDIDKIKNKNEKYLIFWQIQMLAFTLTLPHIHDRFRNGIGEITTFVERIENFLANIEELDYQTNVSFTVIYRDTDCTSFGCAVDTFENAFTFKEGKLGNLINVPLINNNKIFAHEIFNEYIYSDVEKYNGNFFAGRFREYERTLSDYEEDEYHRMDRRCAGDFYFGFNKINHFIKNDEQQINTKNDYSKFFF